MKKHLRYLSIYLSIYLSSCECHFGNGGRYLDCIDQHIGNEDICFKIKKKYPPNTCKPIDFETEYQEYIKNQEK